MAYSADEIRDFADDATERRLALKAIPEPMGEDDIGYWVEWCKSDDAKLINSPRIVHFFARALARAEAAEAESARLRDVVTKCAATFREYAELHRAKNNAEGDAKARRNEELMTMCSCALVARL